ncbi:hypothetical protein H0H92_012906 [Tricholoma furcatifolium]|nr:hypothetical protein H0H92_012906 [Tricholoma furcatifolium]
MAGNAQLAVRIVISGILTVGILYFVLILDTLHRYGDSMGKEFKKELETVVKVKRRHAHDYSGPFSVPGAGAFSTAPYSRARYTWFKSIKIMDFRFQSRLSNAMPDFLAERDFTVSKWEKFVSVSALEQIKIVMFIAVTRKVLILGIVFHQARSAWLIPRDRQDPKTQSFHYWKNGIGVYLIDTTPVDGQPITPAERFGPIPDGLQRIDIFDRPGNDERSGGRILGRTSLLSTRKPSEGRVHYDLDLQSSNSGPNAAATNATSAGSNQQPDETTATPNSSHSSQQDLTPQAPASPHPSSNAQPEGVLNAHTPTPRPTSTDQYLTPQWQTYYTHTPYTPWFASGSPPPPPPVPAASYYYLMEIQYLHMPFDFGPGKRRAARVQLRLMGTLKTVVNDYREIRRGAACWGCLDITDGNRRITKNPQSLVISLATLALVALRTVAYTFVTASLPPTQTQNHHRAGIHVPETAEIDHAGAKLRSIAPKDELRTYNRMDKDVPSCAT